MLLTVIVYLATIIFANVTVSLYQGMVYVNSLLFIGLDLTLKDRFQVHLRWFETVAIALMGGLLTLILNVSFMPIAIASTSALLVAFAIDYIVFKMLVKHVMTRVLVSNLFGSFADSLVFAILAPFPFTWTFVLTMFILKAIGGSISGYILVKRNLIGV